MASIGDTCSNKLTLYHFEGMGYGKVLTPGNPGNHIAIASIPDKDFLKVQRKFLHRTQNVLETFQSCCNNLVD